MIRSGDEKKFRELILYIAKKCEDCRNFGATKLNKILFIADFRAYLHLGSPITGQSYKKLDKGPAPAYLVPIRDQMENDGDIRIIREAIGRKTQNRIKALRDPDETIFSKDELSIVDDVIRYLWNLSAQVVSDLTHEFIGWELAEMQEEIPYSSSIFVVPKDRDIPAQVKQIALSLVGAADNALNLA